MSKQESFCTIDIPNIETAVWLKTLFNASPAKVLEWAAPSFKSTMNSCTGGTESLIDSNEIRHVYVWNQVNQALDVVCFDYTRPPWLKTTAPEEIYDNAVIYSKDGIKVGCCSLALDEMREMVKKCEGAT